MSDTKSSFHPALAVSNIKNNIPIVLEMENVQYATWAELFKIHARSNKVLHHIVTPEHGTVKTPSTDDEKELWSTLDATVLQWIYSTISTDLLQTIIEPDSTAMEAWGRLRDIFQDNKNSRAVTLEQEFSHTSMEDFPNASAYCQRLKELADQLKNVGAPVSNDRLVLQLVAGLTEAYNGVGTLLRQSNPLPPFYQARSMLTLEEAGLAKKAAIGAPCAMVAAAPRDADDAPQLSSYPDNRGNGGGKKGSHRNYGGKNNRGGGRGGGKGGRHGGGSNTHGGGRGGNHSGQQQQSGYQQGNGAQTMPWPWQWPWPIPPCPYPVDNWAKPNANQKQAGILGPFPQAFTATGPQTPTDIEAAMHTLGLNPPDANWYMDTGATSHMTSGQDGVATNEM
ncbi:uncharacterized protein [Spinacia oleracea]|uniref:Uncharacterized protein isoform X2 n=1 Tax=Spinacia oleracea TaxID=3562 RepID=A0ABM3QME2_SPIOL|nr:uncharacterized protein LOC130460862 isoform X2 [Spinacia oleracea]